MSGNKWLLHFFHTILLYTLISTQAEASEKGSGTPVLPKPSIIVLYKDHSGTFDYKTDESGNLQVELANAMTKKIADINISASHQDNPLQDRSVRLDSHPFRLTLPLGKENANSRFNADWNLEHLKTRRSMVENGARVLVPLLGAAAAMGSVNDGRGISWRHPERNMRGSAGHLMVMASVNNLIEEVGDGMAGLLEEYSIPGLGKIPPEWQARGVMAVMILSYAGITDTGLHGSKENLSMYEASKFFAMSRFVSHSNLLLGEASGKLIDSIYDLPPGKRKILTSALGGFATGSLWYLLSSRVTHDYEGKISNATVFGINRAIMPFIDDYLSQWSDDKLTRHISSNLVMTGISLSAATPLYLIRNSYGPTGTVSHLSGMVAGSFTKFVGASLGQVLGPRTMREYFGDSKVTPAAMLASSLAVGFITHKIYKSFGVDCASKHPLREIILYKFRDGLFASLVTGSITATIEEVVRWGFPQRQQARLKLRVHSANYLEDETLEGGQQSGHIKL